MMRIIWWISLGAKAQGIWLFELVILVLFKLFFLKNDDIFWRFRGFLVGILGMCWLIIVFAVGFKTWKQIQFEFPVLRALGSIVIFLVSKALGDQARKFCFEW